MSKANFLEKLLDGAEVEWKSLDNISIKISSGRVHLQLSIMLIIMRGDIPWLRTQDSKL
jgi:type I restriction enzyme S subunit